ncbi:DUF58 domain-containing protein [Dehalogenimonas etheniformans]|uniref:DUF58 domain-containing protein n=1 Tax=Dehalogenimonas etheniformans TaxID=1536648 RepID=A0A2P5P8A7_9CHLR|nr:DUF58 domain-containing protein [Dehalogenimonas etheniformans]PPD58519.1 DUF58 domain-containing protein [Dehalogenimonas etheniformans]QNT76717.1 DUF58 domain-containing protein [Dehalogenimonas etheniformans]
MGKRWGLIAVTGLLAAAVAVTGSVLVLRVFYAWSLSLALGFLWVAFTSRGISFSITPLPDRAQVGMSLRQQVSISVKGFLPKPGISIQANNDLPGGNVTTTMDLWAGKATAWQADYPLNRRGRFHLGSFSLQLGDPFGLFRRDIQLGSSSEILVHPLTVPLPPFSLLGLNGSGLSKRMPESLSASASNIREYTTGDSLRHIHWRSTAHTGRYMVKVFDADRSRHHPENFWVILDMGSNHSGREDDSTAEYAVTLAASLAKEYISHGYRFGLLAAGTEPVVFPSNTGQEHLTDILDFLAVVTPNGSFSFSELLARHQGLFGSNSTVIIITPSPGSSLIESFHQLNSRGCAAAYFLIDGADFGGYSPAAAGRTLTQLGAPVYLLKRAETFKQSLDKAANATPWLEGASRS